MITLEYPSKNFFKRSKAVVNTDDIFSVKVVSKKKGDLLRRSSPFLFEDNGKLKSVWLMINMFLGLTNFLTLHFYALAAEYVSNYDADKSLVIYEKK